MVSHTTGGQKQHVGDHRCTAKRPQLEADTFYLYLKIVANTAD